MTQVIGRAGRADKPGRAIVQTNSPENPVLLLAAKQDYTAFYEGEIALRRAFLFPPFCQLAVFTLSGEKESEVLRETAQFRKKLEQALKHDFSDVKLIVYGPFDAPIYRLKNIYRKRFIIKYKNNPRTRALFEHLLVRESRNADDGRKITLDIGPALI